MLLKLFEVNYMAAGQGSAQGIGLTNVGVFDSPLDYAERRRESHVRLKIEQVTAFPYWPERLSKPQLVVRVRASGGCEGWGEAGFSFRERAVTGAIEHLSDLLVGREAFQIGAIWQELYRSHYFEGCRTHAAAISAIDVALHDLKARALGVPVYDLFGGSHRQRIRCFGTTSGSTVDETIASAVELKRRGFSGVRTHVLLPPGTPEGFFEPRLSIAPSAAAALSIREKLGPNLFLGIDYHHRLTVPETVDFCQQVGPATLNFLEEPIRAQTADAYHALRRMVDVPFAIGEEFTSKWEFRPFLESQALQYARIDIANIGGFTEAMKVAGWCETHYIDVMPHNPLGPVNTAATIHFAAALPNLGLLEARPHQIHDPQGVDFDIYPVQPLLDQDSFIVPRTPGLGVEVNVQALKAAVARYRNGHQQRLRRGDGGLTNS
jgi:galactonate dehydratase